MRAIKSINNLIYCANKVTPTTHDIEIMLPVRATGRFMLLCFYDGNAENAENAEALICIQLCSYSLSKNIHSVCRS